MTLAKELRLLSDQVADLEIEAQELKHNVFTLRTENAKLKQQINSVGGLTPTEPGATAPGALPWGRNAQAGSAPAESGSASPGVSSRSS